MLRPLGAVSMPVPREAPSGPHSSVELSVPCLPPSRRIPRIEPSSACATSRHCFSSGDGPDSDRFCVPSSVETQTWSPSM